MIRAHDYFVDQKVIAIGQLHGTKTFIIVYADGKIQSYDANHGDEDKIIVPREGQLEMNQGENERLRIKQCFITAQGHTPMLAVQFDNLKIVGYWMDQKT